MLAVSTMALVRATLGFLTFHLAFWLRTGCGQGVVRGVVVASAGGTMLGNAVAPSLRRRLREERMLVGALA